MQVGNKLQFNGKLPLFLQFKQICTVINICLAYLYDDASILGSNLRIMVISLCRKAWLLQLSKVILHKSYTITGETNADTKFWPSIMSKMIESFSVFRKSWLLKQSQRL